MKDLVKCNYKLLDCGEFEKLEQIDDLIIRRPALQAEWKKNWEMIFGNNIMLCLIHHKIDGFL